MTGSFNRDVSVDFRRLSRSIELVQTDGYDVAVGDLLNGKLDVDAAEDLSESEEPNRDASDWRWVILIVMCVNICVSYMPQYSFVPIIEKAPQPYGGVNPRKIDWLCIVYSLVYVPGAFLTGPIVAGLGTRWTFLLALSLTVLGCLIRTGLESPMWQGAAMPGQEIHFPNVTANQTLTARSGRQATGVLSFSWLLIGQAIAALGQPLIVNLTSEMGAEWFPPSERPLAAMVTNLMNFIGSSLSFMLPPMIVKAPVVGPTRLPTQHQITMLLWMHFGLAVIALILTAFLYRPPPQSSLFGGHHREQLPFVAELGVIVKRADFWIVCFQFSIFIMLGHVFDTLEGSLLENAGGEFKASLSSWTALSCCVGAILSTMLESRLIHSATSYKPALMLSHGFMVLSLVLAFLTLYHQWSPNFFVLAVGIMGLATPAWGCSCELGSEVAYPAKEATISSLLEATGNILAVICTVGAGGFLEESGAWILVWLAGAAAVAGLALLGFSGKLVRTAMEGEDESPGGTGLSLLPRAGAYTRHLSRRFSRRLLTTLRGKRYHKILKLGFAMMSFVLVLAGCRVLFGMGSEGALPWLPPILENVSQPHGRTTANYLIVCKYGKIQQREEARARRFMLWANQANMKVEEMPCAEMDGAPAADIIKKAIESGLLPRSSSSTLFDVNKETHEKNLLKAITHMRILQNVSSGDKLVNIFETREVVYRHDYILQRNWLLQKLPADMHMVKLNVAKAAGEPINNLGALSGLVYRMRGSATLNTGLSNYAITPEGAAMALQVGRDFDGRSIGYKRHFPEFLLDGLLQRSDFHGFSVGRDMLTHWCSKKDTTLDWCRT